MRSGICGSVILIVILWAPALAYNWADNPGDGSPENPYQISEPNHLIALGEDVEISQGANTFILLNDLVFDPNHNPCHVFEQTVIPLFRGCLDGRGFTIENLRMSVSTYNNEPVGLVGQVTGGQGIRNLNVRNAQLTTGDDFQVVGILCGLNMSHIHNCRVSGTITCGTGSITIGAICGSNGDSYGNDGIITHCHSDVSITSSSATGGIGECGGICGYNNGPIAHCSSDGTIEAWSLSFIGGICGRQDYGEIVSCSARVNITAQRGLLYSGGLCGESRESSIRHSYAAGDLTSVGVFLTDQGISRVGGFCGYNVHGKIDSCYSTGDISCGPSEYGDDEESGGFCGINYGAISNCYSAGNVICGAISSNLNKERWVGGFCGTNYASIENCYSTGAVLTDAPGKAGFCYVNQDTIADSFWDVENSGLSMGVYSGDASGVTGKTTDQMLDPSTFLNAGWDFVDETTNGEEDIWDIQPNHYPSLYRECYSGGDGSPATPFQLSCARDIIRLGKNEQHYYDYFVLTDDIDLSTTVFTESPIAPALYSSGHDFRGVPFCGDLNGAGRMIDYLTIQTGSAEKEYVGLFGGIGTLGRIQNLRLNHFSIAGTELEYAGAICGVNYGTIQRCSVSGNLTGKLNMGGICGANRGDIIDVYACGEYTGNISVGGICGISGYYQYPPVGNLYRCYAAATIQTQEDTAGGLASYLYPSANIYDSYWDITVSGVTSGYYVTPEFWGIIENVQGYTTAQMKQRANFVGWDFVGESGNGVNEIWRMCADGVDYPRLSWEFAREGDFACGDGVDWADLQALAEHWLSVGTAHPALFNHGTDANGDERIDLTDFAVLAENRP